MKKLLLLLILMCCLGQLSFGQEKLKKDRDFKKYTEDILNATDNKITIERDNYFLKKKTNNLISSNQDTLKSGTLFTEPTLNNLFAKKMAYYLSGSNDVSTFKNYFTTSSKDKTVNIGFNKVYRTKLANEEYNDTERITKILTLGLKGSLGTFFQEKTVQSDIGATIGYTKLSRGKVDFSSTYRLKDTLIEKRKYISAFLLKELERDLAQFDSLNKGLANIGLTNSAVIRNTILTKRKALVESLFKKFRETFSDEEEKAGEYDFTTNNWKTVKAYIPANTTKYELANTNATKIDTLNFFPINFEITFARFMQWKTEKSFFKPSYLFTFTVAFSNTNALKTLETYGDISNRDTVASELGLKKVKINDKSVYQGNNNSFFAVNIKPRVLLNWRQSTVVSLDLFGDLSFGKYNHHDAGFGLLFSLPDKDGKKPVNIEPTFTIRDIGSNLVKDKGWLDKLLVGVSISLPFNSLVF